MFKDQDCHFIRDKDAKFLAQCEEKAYRRGVSQTIAMLCHSVRENRLALDVKMLTMLEGKALGMRYAQKRFPFLLHQLIEFAEQQYELLKAEQKPEPQSKTQYVKEVRDSTRIAEYNGIKTEHEYPPGTIRFDPPPLYSVLTFQNGGEMLAFDPDGWKHVAKAKPVKTGKVGRPRKLS